MDMSDQIRSDQLLSCVRPFATPWIAARQASLSITNSQSSLRLTSIESVMPSSHLILCRPLLLPPIPPNIRVFSNESTLRMRHVHTAIFKMDNQRGPTLQHVELCSMLCGSLDGSGVWGRMDICICMAKSLHCASETVTPLFVNGLYPNTK